MLQVCCYGNHIVLFLFQITVVMMVIVVMATQMFMNFGVSKFINAGLHENH